MKKYLHKRIQIREKRLRYDFLPSMLEIIERPANKAAGCIILLIAMTFASAVVWAYFSRLDIVVTATGMIVPEDNLIPLQSEYSGRVAELCAGEDDEVEEDVTVLSISQINNEMDIEGLRYELEVLRVQKEAYESLYAEFTEDNREYFPEDFPEDFRESGIDSTEYGEYAPIVDALLVEQELFHNQEKQYELQAAASTVSAEEKEMYYNQMESFRLQRKLTLLQNLNSLEVRIHEKEAELQEAEYFYENREVRTPVAGTITQLQINTPGVFVTAGQTLGYVIPRDSDRIFRAYVGGADIEHVREGDKVSVRLRALDDSPYERMEGVVARIGEVTVNMEGVGSAYEVEIRLQTTPDTEDLVYRVGMEGSCDILIGERSVLDYFLEPFQKGLRDSLKEL